MLFLLLVVLALALTVEFTAEYLCNQRVYGMIDQFPVSDLKTDSKWAKLRKSKGTKASQFRASYIHSDLQTLLALRRLRVRKETSLEHKAQSRDERGLQIGFILEHQGQERQNQADAEAREDDTLLDLLKVVASQYYRPEHA